VISDTTRPESKPLLLTRFAFDTVSGTTTEPFAPVVAVVNGLEALEPA
jgi:hypothetical protein